MNLQAGVRVRQPKRAAWTIDHLRSQRAIYLSNCLDASTKTTYQSGLNSYLAFCSLHNLDIEPSPDTLSFYISFMARQTGPSRKLISICTITSYLSGISHHLEPFYPNIQPIRKHPLVVKTLHGAEKTDGQMITHKLPIEDVHLRLLVSKFGTSDNFDDCLFLAICFTAYHGLMRLRELVVPDNPKFINFCKLSLHCMVEFIQNDSIQAFKFNLPTHKADHRYHGNSVIIQSRVAPLDPVSIFSRYLSFQDSSFPFFPHLWIRQDGSLPSRSWFTRRLHLFLPKHFLGHSFRAGGATHLAAIGIPNEKIQAMGCWSSEAWCIYVRKNPIILLANVSSALIFDALNFRL